MSLKNSQEKAVLPSVHFSLRATTENPTVTVNDLHSIAKQIGFSRVGPTVNFEGEQCAIFDEPFKTLKSHARGFLIHNKILISYLPLSIVGFECLLPNGNTLAIGLCKYPKCLMIGRECLRTGRDDRQEWMSYIKTVKNNQKKYSQCIESHNAVLSLFHICEDMGILTSVQDPYGQWKNPNERDFRKKMIDKNLCGH